MIKTKVAFLKGRLLTS